MEERYFKQKRNLMDILLPMVKCISLSVGWPCRISHVGMRMMRSEVITSRFLIGAVAKV